MSAKRYPDSLYRERLHRALGWTKVEPKPATYSGPYGTFPIRSTHGTLPEAG